ncbi:MAG TPA: sigma-54 dependent transcriptional regulator [Kofleriaceae bacterium]|nr:sigma-54 dependent transcriptional regulator [Kofleriaceae bacterium]
MPRILVIEDDREARDAAHGALRSLGHDVVAADASTALALLADDRFEVVVAGFEPPRRADRAREALAVPELVCLPQPLSAAAVVEAVGELEQRAAIQKTLDVAHRASTAAPDLGAPVVGRSPEIELVLGRVAAVAATDAPVLLTGESGTGKELLAHMIHERSARRDRPLVIVNCAAFPEALIEAELFGHERGAFTGALQKRDGKFKAAEGGTLFLDEINGLSLAAQAKLLRVLQDGRFHPLGTNTEVAVDVRLISATNRELGSMVAEGTFRGDLYYRIKVLDLDVPPLRARTGDLPVLVSHFLRKHAPAARRPTLSPRAWAALSTYPFPGNVRELEHAIQRAVVLARGFEIDLEHLPREISPTISASATLGDRDVKPLSEAVRVFEREYLRHALEATHGNKTQAARLLGMSRKHLWEKLRRLGLLER